MKDTIQALERRIEELNGINGNLTTRERTELRLSQQLLLAVKALEAIEKHSETNLYFPATRARDAILQIEALQKGAA
jgi:hypothetical protein